MNLRTCCCLCYALLAPVLGARNGAGFCGTYPGNWRESLDHHAKMERRRAANPKVARAATARRDADAGNISVLENDDSLFGRRNPFNVDKFQVSFTPTAGKYEYATAPGGFDQAAAGSGNPVTDWVMTTPAASGSRSRSRSMAPNTANSGSTPTAT